jgi:hypothetical protein
MSSKDEVDAFLGTFAGLLPRGRLPVFSKRRFETEEDLALSVVNAMMAQDPREVVLRAGKDEERARLLSMAVQTVCAMERWKAETRGRKIEVTCDGEPVKTVTIV